MTDLYSLRDQVLALNSDDCANLRALLDHAEQRSPLDTTHEEELLWDGLVYAAPAGARHFRNLSEFLRDKRYGVPRAEYKDAVRQLFDLIYSVERVRHPHQDQVALIELMLECLAADQRRRQVETTPKSLVQAMPRLRVAIDFSYPNYCDSGMLHKLIRVAAPMVAAE